MSPLVSVDGLTLTTAAGAVLLDGADLSIGEGEAVGLHGPSGAGKTTLGLAVLGHLRPGIEHAAGRVVVDGRDMLPRPAPGVRGTTVAHLAQDPGSALDPYHRIATTLLLATGTRVPRAGRRAVVAGLLAGVGLTAELAHRFPHQLSGGQAQRVALAAALARSPRLLVLDEPTTALDLRARRGVLDLLARRHREGLAMLWIGHDLASMRAAVSRTVEVRAGRTEPSTALVAGAGKGTSGAGRAGRRDLVTGPQALACRGLRARYRGESHDVLHGVDLTVRRGEVVALLGVSGVGKSTLARCLTGLHVPSAGEVRVEGSVVAPDVRRRALSARAAIGLVTQQPVEALHSRQSVRTAIARPLRVLRGVRTRAEQDREVERLLAAVHLPAGVATALPDELSGGQRQRVALARALAGSPAVLVCDEVTSALDAETSAGVLDLLDELRRDRGLGVLLITHDARTAAASDAVAVLAEGRVVAEGPAAELLPHTDDLEERVMRLLTHDPLNRRPSRSGGGR